jgi:hypothetical protein
MLFARKSPGAEIGQTIAQYDVHLETIYDNQTTQKMFAKFLKKQKVVITWKFLNEISKYEKLNTPQSRYTSAKKIIETFLLEKSKKYVAVSQLQKQKTIHKYNSYNATHCPRSLFASIKSTVLGELKEHYLEPFLHSEQFAKFVQKQCKQNPKYLEELGSLKPMSEEAEEEKPEPAELANLGVLYDPNRIEATNADFDRLLTDIRDKEMWQLVYNSTRDDRSVFVSKSPYFNGKKGLKKMFETGILPCTVDEAFNCYADYSELLTIEKEIDDIEMIEYREMERFAATVLRFKYKLPFPLKNRDFCLLHSVRKEPNGNLIMIRKSINHPQCLPNRSFVRGVVSGGIAFEKVDDNHTRYSQSYFVDYGGVLNHVSFNKIIAMRDNAWQDAFIKSIESRRGLGRPVVSNRVIETLEYFERKNLMFTY